MVDGGAGYLHGNKIYSCSNHVHDCSHLRAACTDISICYALDDLITHCSTQKYEAARE